MDACAGRFSLKMYWIALQKRPLLFAVPLFATMACNFVFAVQEIVEVHGLVLPLGQKVFEKGCCGQVNVTSDVIRVRADGPDWLAGKTVEIFLFGLLPVDSPWRNSGRNVKFKIPGEHLGALNPQNGPESQSRQPFLEHLDGAPVFTTKDGCGEGQPP